ncbi:MAG: glycosyltransferase family 2 protein [Bacillota bacterium]
MNNTKISIIIPTYNDEEYIQKCLYSIVSQSYTNIEVIVVVDGATDNTLEIAKQYIDDDRVKVYFQNNAGSGPARNYGLSKATGEYVMFVDADDWLPVDALNSLAEGVNDFKYDLVVGARVLKSSHHWADQREIIDNFMSKEKVLTQKKFLKCYIERSIQATWKILYRHSLIKENNIKYPDLRRSQDIGFNLRIFAVISSILFIDKEVYCYRMPNIRQNRRNEKKYVYAHDNYIDIVLKLRRILFDSVSQSGYKLSNEELCLINLNHFNHSLNCIYRNAQKMGRGYKEWLVAKSEDTHFKEIISGCIANDRLDEKVRQNLEIQNYKKAIRYIKKKCLLLRIKACVPIEVKLKIKSIIKDKQTGGINL